MLLTVVTGALGAGKTTLINALLCAASGRSLAVVVNELGALGVDGALIDAGGLATVELADGCVCCATLDALSGVLVSLLDRWPRVERVLFETTGAADPGPVIWTILADPALRARVQLDGVIVVVDCIFAASVAALSPEWARQIALADLLVLSKALEAGPETTAALRARLEALRPGVPVWLAGPGADGAALWAAVEGAGAWSAARLEAELDALSGPMCAVGPAGPLAPLRPAAQRPVARHNAGLGVRAARVEGWLDPILVELWLDRALGGQAGVLLRAKGLLALAGAAERVVLQGVVGQREGRPGRPWGDEPPVSIVVLIGIDVDLDALEAGLRATRLELFT